MGLVRIIIMTCVLSACTNQPTTAQTELPSEDAFLTFLANSSADWPEDVEDGDTPTIETFLIAAIVENDSPADIVASFQAQTDYEADEASRAITVLFALGAFFDQCMQALYENDCRVSDAPYLLDALEQADDPRLRGEVIASLREWHNEAGYLADLNQTFYPEINGASIFRNNFMTWHSLDSAYIALANGIEDNEFLDAVLSSNQSFSNHAFGLAIFDYLANRFTEAGDGQRASRAYLNLVIYASQHDLSELVLSESQNMDRAFGLLPFEVETDDTNVRYNLAVAILAYALENENEDIASRTQAWLEANLPDIETINSITDCAGFQLEDVRLFYELPSEDRCRISYEHRILAQARGNFDFLSEFISRELNADQAMMQFVLGGETLPPPWFIQPNWNWSDIDGIQLPALLRLKRQYLQELGLSSLARQFERHVESSARNSFCSSWSRSSAPLPETALPEHSELDARLDHFQELTDDYCNTVSSFQEIGITTRTLPNARPAYFIERPIHEARTTHASTGNPPEMPRLPYTVIRSEFSDGEWIAIYVSRAVDPAGEVGAGGYWVTRTMDGGQRWAGQYYLGLQANFPYVILEASDIPLFVDNTLQIAANIQEIDRSSITFPPIGMRLSREETGLFLEMPWDNLTRDQDDDGLTDILEHRVGLDYLQRDTDGDGRRDGFDPLPSVPHDSSQPEQVDFYSTMLSVIFGVDAQAIVVRPDISDDGNGLAAILEIAGNPEPLETTAEIQMIEDQSGLFSGLGWSQIPLVIHPPEVYQALEEEYGPTYPVRFPVVQPNSSQTVWYIEWNARWVGGAFLIRQDDTGYEVAILSSWIT